MLPQGWVELQECSHKDGWSSRSAPTRVGGAPGVLPQGWVELQECSHKGGWSSRSAPTRMGGAPGVLPQGWVELQECSHKGGWSSRSAPTRVGGAPGVLPQGWVELQECSHKDGWSYYGCALTSEKELQGGGAKLLVEGANGISIATWLSQTQCIYHLRGDLSQPQENGSCKSVQTLCWLGRRVSRTNSKCGAFNFTTPSLSPPSPLLQCNSIIVGTESDRWVLHICPP